MAQAARYGRRIWAASKTLAIAFVVVQLTASSAAFGRGSVEPNQNSAATTASAGAAKRATRLITDETGRQIEVPVDVRRIVSLAPNLTETVYALGLEDKLAADTSYCDIPPAAKDKPHVGGPVDPSLETIVAMHPDLVLATMINRRETVDALAHLGIAVYTTDPHTVRGMLESTSKLADLMGASVKGAGIVSGLEARLDALKIKLSERPLAHVLFVVWEDPLITIGQNTFIADALRYAGAESAIVATQDWPQISLEEVMRVQPDYIILTPEHAERDNSNQLAELRARGIWRELNAVKTGRLALASNEIIRPSPGLVDAIETLARQLHPEVFAGPAAGAKTSSSNAASDTIHAVKRGECISCGR